MCFLFGGLRFREQVSRSMGVILVSSNKVTDLQQHGNANERMPLELERYEPAFAGKSFKVPCRWTFHPGSEVISKDVIIARG